MSEKLQAFCHPVNLLPQASLSIVAPVACSLDSTVDRDLILSVVIWHVKVLS